MTPAPGRERGAGLLSTWFALVVFLAFLFLSVHVLVGLWVTSSIEAVAYDAARDVATSGAGVLGDDDAWRRATAAAERDAVSLIGGLDPEFTWTRDDRSGTVVLEVVAHPPGFLLALATDGLGFDEVSETVRVRIEERR